MFDFLKDMRKKGLVTDEMLELYNGVFINQPQYDELKAIAITAQ